MPADKPELLEKISADDGGPTDGDAAKRLSRERPMGTELSIRQPGSPSQPAPHPSSTSPGVHERQDRRTLVAANETGAGSSWNPIVRLRDRLLSAQSSGPGAAGQSPDSPSTAKIPLSGSVPPGAVQVDPQRGVVSIVVRDAPLNEVLGVLARSQNLNIITGNDITAPISVTLTDVPFEQALTNILSVFGYTWVRQDNILIVTSIASEGKASPAAQGREVRVFPLDYVSAADIDLVIKGLLSPAGQSFTTASASDDNRKTKEIVVVEDLPTYLYRIEQYIQQVDHPPRQVLIEAYVLSVELKNDVNHGVNLAYLDQLGSPAVTLKTTGFASKTASPALLFNVTAGSLDALLETLETTTDAKTLAKPKVLVLNGQEAKVQIGEKLGYRITTTTQTSSLESVEFLDVGVVLTVTPWITRDDCVLLKVKPEISSGEINSTTELPEEETTEVETALMLPNGHGMVIGGLIQESDTETQSKVPIVGDLWLIGRLFQKRELKRRREEIIIALIPHVVPYHPERHLGECEEFHRATDPLLYGPVLQNPRPYEPRFPDAGQRLPFTKKTRHLCTNPDHGGWGVSEPREPCAPGIYPVPPGFHQAMPSREGMPGAGDMRAFEGMPGFGGEAEQTEIIPVPEPQPTQ